MRPGNIHGSGRRVGPGVGLVAGCAVTPVKLGSAAIVGDQRISIATLGTETANLSQAAKQYPSTVNLTPVQETQATLTWLIRYQVNEEVARQAGITVSAAQAEAALAAAYAEAVTSAEQPGLTNVTPTEILAARTLEMGVAGIREMSTILTPPEERHPVLTFVGGYDAKQVAAAIRRELLRDGQVFFVHNRVSSIRRVAAQVAELVPEARIAVAHGQMNEHELENIMVDFWERKYDVLVATTIIESGLDIPNANTLIIDRADMYGLSQLHQLRGRVGRGTERAYAYFLYPPEAALTETAHERLATVAQHTEVGAGMYVALKDLEIRGAGNLLGGEQSGHIAGVGFDLYVRMIGEAVNELKGDGPAEKPEVRVELPINAHIPHDYVPGERLRLEAYTRIAAIDSEADVSAALDELSDRYGEPPEPVRNLLEVARLRTAARRAGLTDITAAGNHIRFAPVELPDSRQVRVQRLYPKTVLKPTVRTMLIPVPRTAPIGGQPLRDAELLAWCGEVIRSVLADLAPGALSG